VLENHEYASNTFESTENKRKATSKIIPMNNFSPNMSNNNSKRARIFSWGSDHEIEEIFSLMPEAEKYIDALTETIWNTILIEAESSGKPAR
jgi:hypothetical protein